MTCSRGCCCPGCCLAFGWRAPKAASKEAIVNDKCRISLFKWILLFPSLPPNKDEQPKRYVDHVLLGDGAARAFELGGRRAALPLRDGPDSVAVDGGVDFDDASTES